MRQQKDIVIEIGKEIDVCPDNNSKINDRYATIGCDKIGLYFKHREKIYYFNKLYERKRI